MIWVTRVDGVSLLLNEDHLVWVESNHDTVLVLADGERLRVLEPAREIAERVAAWRLRVSGASWLQLERAAEDDWEER